MLDAACELTSAAPCKARDRGAMIEAICALRARFGRVVFVWNPGHRGIIHNEMADCCAKAHLDQHKRMKHSEGRGRDFPCNAPKCCYFQDRAFKTKAHLEEHKRNQHSNDSRTSKLH